MRKLLLPQLALVTGFLLLIAVVLTHTNFSVSAQGARIAYGDTVEGEINDDNASETWTFVGSADDVAAVTISRLTGDLIPSIALKDPSGTLLFDVIWPDDGTDAFAFSVNLRTSGVFSLLIQGNETAGTYALSLDLKPVERPVEDRMITYGRVVSGEITDETFRSLWKFDGSQNDIIDAEMAPVSGNLLTSLTLVAPGGDVVATMQQDQPNGTAALQAVTLPVTGTYTLVASRVGSNLGEAGTTQGMYQLALTLRVSGQSESEMLPGALRLETKTRVRLTADSPVALFSVEARSVLSVALDAVEPLGAANVNVLTKDRIVLKTLSGIAPLRASVVAVDQDVVWIEITTPQVLEGKPADYVLTVNRFSKADRSREPLLWGRPRRALVTNSPDPDAWYFSAQAGDLVRFTVDPTAPVLDGRVLLTSPDGSIVFESAVYDGFVQPLILQSEGLYEISLISEAVGEEYLISVDRTGAAGFSFDQRSLPEFQGFLSPGGTNSVSGTLSPGTSHMWQVEITTPQRWRFRIEQTTALVPVALVVAAPDGTETEVAVTNNALRVSYLEADFPHPGRYRAVVFDPTGEATGTYTLSGKPITGGGLSLGVPAKGVVGGDSPLNVWWVDLAPSLLFNMQIEVLSGSTIPTLYLVKPDGSLLTSNVGDSNSGQLLGVQITTGGKYGIVVGGNTRDSQVVYRLRTDVSIPFQASTIPLPLSTPVPDELVGLLFSTSPAPIAGEGSKQVTPRIDVDSDILVNARRMETATLIRGEITGEYPYQAWSLSVEARQTLGIAATALDSDEEPSLMLIDSKGTILAENFQPQESDAYLMFRFAASGTCYVVVSLTYGHRYTLWAESLTGIDANVPDVFDGQAIAYGTTVQGEIVQAGDSSVFVFFGTTGDNIAALVANIQNNPSLRVTLLDEEGSVLATAESGDTTRRTYRLERKLPQNGVYRLVIEGEEESSPGRFALHLNLLSATNERHGDLLLDHSVGFLYGGNDIHRWLFNGLAGEKVTLWAEPVGAVPVPFVLQLADSTGHTFWEKRLDNTQNALRLPDVLLPRTGVYQAVVSGGRTQSGLYRISLERAAGQMLDSTLRYGQTVGQVLTQENFLDVWTFAGSRGDSITVLLRAVRGDPVSLNLQLRSHDGQVLATTGADGTGQRTFLDGITLPSDGHYSVVVGNADSLFDGAAVYELTVLLEDSQARSVGTVIHYGQQVEGVFSIEDTVDTWLFEGSEGDMVDVTVAGSPAPFSFQVSIMSTDWHVAAAAQRAELLVEAQALEDGEAHISQYVLPASGVYALQVGTSTGAWGRYQLSLLGQAAGVNQSNTITAQRQYEGQIASINPADTWTLVSQRDDQISVMVTPASQSTLSPTLALINGDGIVLASAEAAGNEPTRIENFRVPVAGTYTVVVGRTLGPRGHSEGRYTLELTQTPAPLTPVTQIAYAQPVNGGLDKETFVQRWRFVGQQGDVVYAAAVTTGGTLDPVLRLYDANGYLLAQGDDEQGTDANLSFTLPADGTYDIEVTRYGGLAGTTSGNYSLAITRVYRFESITPDRLLIYGDRIRGNVDSENSNDQWVFSGEKGDIIHAGLQFPLDDAPPSLILTDPAGELLAAAERERDTASVDSFELPASGFYVLEIRRPGDARTRYTPYRLSLDLVQPAQDAVAQGGILTLDRPVTGRFFSAPDSHAWIFHGRAGESVALLLESLSGAVPIRSILVGPTGNTLLATSSVVNGMALSPAGSLQLPVDGLYMVFVTVGGETLGADYRLTVKTTAVPDQVVQELSFFTDGFGMITDIQPQQTWAFEGSPGQVLSLRAAALSGDLQPTLLLWGPGGRIIQEGVVEDTPNGKQASINNFVVTEAGRYEVSLSRTGGANGDSSGSYRLMLRQEVMSGQAASAVDIAFGAKINSFTRTATPYYYAFQSLKGDLIAISVKVSSANGLPDIWLESENGFVFSPSLQQTDQETIIPMFVVPADGRYIIGLQSDEVVYYELIVFRRDIGKTAGAAIRNLGRAQAFADGILDPNQVVRWTFEVETDEVLSFVVDTGGTSLRTDMVLVGPDGYIAGATEQVGQPVTVLGPVRFIDSGRYDLLVSSWLGSAGGSTGRYSIQIEEAGPDISGSSGGHIQVPGTVLTGGFTTTDGQDIWTFDGQAGQTLSILLEPVRDVGTIGVELVDPAGNPILSGDHESILLGAPVLLPLSGIYQLILNGVLENNAPLDYRLSVQMVDRIPASIGTEHAHLLNYGERQTGYLAEGEQQEIWVFYGETGHRINVEVKAETPGFLPIAQLIGPDGRDIVIQSSDMDGKVQLLNIVLAGDGFYGLIVGRGSGSEQGSLAANYQVLLGRLAPGAMYQGVLDEETSAKLTTDQPLHQWSLLPEVSGNFTVEITLLSPGMDLEIAVEARDMSLLGMAVTDGTALASVPVYLTGSEAYRVIVATRLQTVDASYNLRIFPSIMQTSGALLDVGKPDVGHIDNGHLADQWQINGLAAGMVTATVARFSGDLDLLVSLFDRDGILIRQAVGNPMGVASLEVELSNPGVYSLVVSRDGDEAGTTSGDYTVIVVQ